MKRELLYLHDVRDNTLQVIETSTLNICLSSASKRMNGIMTVLTMIACLKHRE